VRVAMVCPYALTDPGGVQGQVLGLTAAMRDLGHHVEVFAPGAVRPWQGVATTGRAVGIRVNGSVATMAPHPAAAWRTAQAVRRGRFDVVHVHEPLAPSIGLAAVLDHAAPTVATFHAAGDRTPYRWFAGPARRVAERIDIRVAVSPAAAALAQRYLGGSDEVLFNAVDAPDTVQPVARTERTRSVLFLGRHDTRKGLEVLVRAWSLMPVDTTLLVAGDGPVSARLRQATAHDPRVQWLGRVSEAEKWRLLASAGVLCAPSLGGESFGVVLLEAMASGLPVVASDLPGYRSAVGDGGAARLVAPGDPEQLATALGEVLADPVRADALAALGEARAGECSVSALVARYLDCYHRAASGVG
jgi:phosphatidylinositol alpha-mannosyltransferase